MVMAGGMSVLYCCAKTGEAAEIASPKQSKVRVVLVFMSGFLLLWMARSLHFLDVRTLPGLVKQRLFGTIEAEQDFELSASAGWDPIRFFARQGLRTEIDVNRAVDVLLQSWRLGGATGPGDVADEPWVARS